jgi:bifunctional N-acetylglucosamine-1-phosphate-uridyltransferase/glucosamine-1-phosphate-acetyltransferase GlmU-like protein
VALSRVLIIPAGGRGSRLATGSPKPLVKVAGRTMLDHLADLYMPFVTGIVVIANPESRSAIAAWARARDAVVGEQRTPTGMLDAILLAAPAVQARQPDSVWITWADQIAVLPATLRRLADAEERQSAAMVVPTARRADPYIHFTRSGDGRIDGVLQRREGDPMPPEGEGDIGLFALRCDTFERDLPEFARHAPSGSRTGERNFLPFIPWLAQRRTVATIACTERMEAIGINTPEDLRTVEAWLQSRSCV